MRQQRDTGANANAIVIHDPKDLGGTDYVTVRDNIIFKVESGVGMAWGSNQVLENNLVYRYGHRGADSGFQAREGIGFTHYQAEDGTVRGNTFVDGGNIWGRIAHGPIRVENNVFVDAGGIDVSSRVDENAADNAYYGDSEP